MPWLSVALVAAYLFPGPQPTIEPQIIETRAVALTQTVTLYDIPAGAKQVRMWVPMPSDTAWQRVVEREVVSAPGTWKLVRQGEGRGDFVYVEIANPKPGEAAVVVKCKFERQGVHFPIDEGASAQSVQAAAFSAELDRKAPLMEVDEKIAAIADKACGAERDPAKQAMILMHTVSELADHYSKDKSKPQCGRGAASDCLEQGGGCCTDLHSLFIALARARNVPARMQYGYRLLDAKAGAPYDPGYRCWVEYFIPGAGWVPTDIVAADNFAEENGVRWASLSATRVWLWQGRSFELTPPATAGHIDTMTCGWAEIDGKPINPVPSRDGSVPAQLRRTVQFEVLHTDRTPQTPKLPE